MTEIFRVSLESILARTNSLIYVGKTLIQLIHFLPCVKENAKPTSTKSVPKSKLSFLVIQLLPFLKSKDRKH